MESNTDLRQIYIEKSLSIEPVDNPVITISENRFVSDNWLHLLASHVRGEDVPIYLWVRNVALKPFNPVDVLSDEGEVLFTIPPLLDNDKEIYPEDLQNKISDKVNEINNKNKVIPNSGNRQLVTELIDTVAPPKPTANRVKQWAGFIKHYDIKVDGVIKNQLTQSSSGGVTLKIDDEDIDDTF